MTASRARGLPQSLTLCAALGAAVLAGGNALAQGAPVELVPPTRQEQPAAVPPPPAQPTWPGKASSPQAPAIGADAVRMDRVPSMLGGAVEAQQLGQVNPDVAGVLTEAQGGFGPAMWWGADRRVIDALLPRLPVASRSPVMFELSRRLLLTGAQAPEGGQPGALLGQRVSLLNTMGDFAGVEALIAMVPDAAAYPALAKAQMDRFLLSGDTTRACQLADAFIHTPGADTYWQMAFNACQAVEGKSQDALLGLSLLEEVGIDDPVFFQLVDALARQSKMPVIESLPNPTPLHLALARAAHAKLPADVAASGHPGGLRAIANDPEADIGLRLEAAERAAAQGAISAEELRQIYAAAPFSDEDLKNPLSATAERGGPESRALLYRSTLMQEVPAAQAESLKLALEPVRDAERYAAIARAFQPQFDGLKPGPELAWFAPEAVRAYLVTGNLRGAQDWYPLIEDAARREPDMARALTALMPVARLSGFEGADAWTIERLPEWWAGASKEPGARAQGAMLAAALDGLGEMVPEALWVELSQGDTHVDTRVPDPSLSFLLEGSASQARVGETVLVSLVMLGEGGLHKVHPQILNQVLKALRTIGLREEARKLALEAVTAAGL